MKTKKLQAIDVDDILEDCPHAIECFNDGDFSVSWGDAAWTLVDQTMFYGMLDDAGLSRCAEDINNPQTPLDFEMNTIYERLEKLGDSTYIALNG